MKTCYKCGGTVRKTTTTKEGRALTCLRCAQCGEEYFTSSEIARFDIAMGRRVLVRKIGTLGESTIVRVPPKVVRTYRLKPGDYGIFEERSDGVLIKFVKAEEVDR